MGSADLRPGKENPRLFTLLIIKAILGYALSGTSPRTCYAPGGAMGGPTRGITELLGSPWEAQTHHNHHNKVVAQEAGVIVMTLAV